MRKLWKKALASILTLAMALSIVPMTAFAAEPVAEMEATPVLATYDLRENNAQAVTQVRVGATMLNVATEDLEDGTTFAILKDTEGEYLAVNLNDQAALAAMDPEILYFYDSMIQMYLTRLGSTQYAIVFHVIDRNKNISRMYGSAYVKEYSTSLTSLFYTTGNLVTRPSSSVNNYYRTLSAFTYSGGNSELNVGLRDATVYLTNGQSVGLPYGSGYLTPK